MNFKGHGLAGTVELSGRTATIPDDSAGIDTQHGRGDHRCLHRANFCFWSACYALPGTVPGLLGHRRVGQAVFCDSWRRRALLNFSSSNRHVCLRRAESAHLWGRRREQQKFKELGPGSGKEPPFPSRSSRSSNSNIGTSR
jgi:hypothetical protein